MASEGCYFADSLDRPPARVVSEEAELLERRSVDELLMLKNPAEAGLIVGGRAVAAVHSERL